MFDHVTKLHIVANSVCMQGSYKIFEECFKQTILNNAKDCKYKKKSLGMLVSNSMIYLPIDFHFFIDLNIIRNCSIDMEKSVEYSKIRPTTVALI